MGKAMGKEIKRGNRGEGAGGAGGAGGVKRVKSNAVALAWDLEAVGRRTFFNTVRQMKSVPMGHWQGLCGRNPLQFQQMITSIETQADVLRDFYMTNATDHNIRIYYNEILPALENLRDYMRDIGNGVDLQWTNAGPAAHAREVIEIE